MKSKGRQYISGITGELLPEAEIRSRAREFFLFLVVVKAPIALHALRDTVFPKFKEAFEFEQQRGKSKDDIKELATLVLSDLAFPDENNDVRSLPSYKTLRESLALTYSAVQELIAWSERFGLIGRRGTLPQDAPLQLVNTARSDAVWPVVAALETLLLGYFVHGRMLETPSGVPLFRPARRPAPPVLDDLEPIQLTTEVRDFREGISAKVLDFLAPNGPPIAPPKRVETPSWDLTWEPEPDFRARIRKDFNSWLKGYVEARKRLASESSLIKAPGKRELIHFGWAIEYHVLRKTADAIAKQESRKTTKGTVEKAVKGISDLIRLQRRAARQDPLPCVQNPQTSLSSWLRQLCDDVLADDASKAE